MFFFLKYWVERVQSKILVLCCVKQITNKKKSMHVHVNDRQSSGLKYSYTIIYMYTYMYMYVLRNEKRGSVDKNNENELPTLLYSSPFFF